jgi:hypothetical protein
VTGIGPKRAIIANCRLEAVPPAAAANGTPLRSGADAQCVTVRPLNVAWDGEPAVPEAK